jgi:ABC-2 type transport system ATP-binding protein
LAAPIIHCRNLQKWYAQHHVLRDVDFQIEPGQLTGFLGPNGAGKTTTLRILLGLLKPSSGSTSIFGKSCQTNGKSIRADIGYLPGEIQFYTNLSGRQTLRYLARVRRRDCTDEIDRLAEVLELDLDKTVRKYSTGMRQKLGLIQALMHKPQLLILDEPTSALDPLVRAIVFDELRNVVHAGRSVLFSSHSLSEVEELCDEIIILRSGKIVEQQKISHLKSKALRRVKIAFASPAAIPASLPASLYVRANDNVLVGTWTGKTTDLVEWLATQKIDDATIETPDLSDLFLTYYRDEESSP